MKVLLHICCAVCAASCLERLRKQGYEVTGFFYNPNIHPPGEYLKRLQEIEELARQQNFPLIVGDYDMEAWSLETKGLGQEPEGGKRCAKCFRLRLEKTKKITQERGFNFFTTTLTIGPHKNAQMVNEIGQDLAGDLFLTRDFKKQDGFKRAQELARQYSLYRQDYCGCIFSLEERRNYDRLHKKTCPSGNKDQTS